MIVMKFISFLIYSVAVVIFMYYVNIFYLYSFYKDFFFCDFKNLSKFDYIIVGAGSAGSVLASKLSNAGAKTLLVEAGGAPLYFFDIPVITPLLMNTPYDWKYVTVPQENACKGLKNHQSIWTAGKILGGSSRLNNMIYLKGHPDDYIPWFSDFKEPIVKNGGSLYVNDQNWHSLLSDAILQGVAELSQPLRNINEEASTGFMRAHLTAKNGERWSTDRLLDQNNRRLKVLTNSFVTKILFKRNKAVGLEFFRHKKVYKVFARKGVILSAGAIGSPKILMLSGIGPKQHLDQFNIKTIADLPVGQHLMDHIITGLDLVTLESSVSFSIADLIHPYALMQYYLLGKGPWTSAGVDVVGTFYSTIKKDNSSVPDLEIMTFPVGLSQDNGIVLRKNLGISDKIFNEYFSPLTYKIAITIAPVLLHPKSFGEVRLKSSNPLEAPVIDPKYLSNKDDILTLIDGIQFVKRLVETKTLKKFGAKLYRKPFPGCDNITFDTTEYWKCYIQHLTFTTYHPGGTCKMGNVVDSEFRIYGTKNLFVVDASVFPDLPSGNIHAPVVMLSEKAAKLFIKNFYRNKKDLSKCNKSDIFLVVNQCI